VELAEEIDDVNVSTLFLGYLSEKDQLDATLLPAFDLLQMVNSNEITLVLRSLRFEILLQILLGSLQLLVLLISCSGSCRMRYQLLLWYCL
jgi:hypothetical protein